MIPPNILAKKILSTCIGLNISEAQLTSDITEIMREHHPQPRLIGYLPHYNSIDASVIVDYPECPFCGQPTCYYEGWKDVTSGEYRALAICANCGNCEEF